MEKVNIPVSEEDREHPDEWWYKIYAAVMIVTAAVITALWIFSRHFSG